MEVDEVEEVMEEVDVTALVNDESSELSEQ